MDLLNWALNLLKTDFKSSLAFLNVSVIFRTDRTVIKLNDLTCFSHRVNLEKTDFYTPDFSLFTQFI